MPDVKIRRQAQRYESKFSGVFMQTLNFPKGDQIGGTHTSRAEKKRPCPNLRNVETFSFEFGRENFLKQQCVTNFSFLTLDFD